MREYILYGWNESKCATHRQNAREGGFKTQCDREGTCVWTGQEHVKLTYQEYLLLQEVLDFANTGQILTDERERRQTIIYLSKELDTIRHKKAEIDGAKGRITHTG